MWSCIISILAGLWVMISPSCFEMSGQAANLNHICGPLFITFAIIALWDINKSVIKANLGIAVFLIIATLFLKESSAVVVSNVLSAAIGILCSLVKRESKRQYGGGWRSLFRKPSND